MEKERRKAVSGSAVNDHAAVPPAKARRPNQEGIDCADGDRVHTPPKKSVSNCRLALVLGDADSGYWNCAGWVAGPRRSLHVSSANWIGHRARLVDLGSDEIVPVAPERFCEGGATAKNYFERRQRVGCWYVVDLVVEADGALARHRNIMATHSCSDAG